jgi:hypothetical protein
MTTLGHHHYPFASRARAGQVLFVVLPALILAVAWWVLATRTDDAPTAARDGVASLQTLIFMHRGDVPVPAQTQPQS